MEPTPTSTISDLVLRAHQTYELARFLADDARAAAFEPLREELFGLTRDTRDELRAGIGTATLRGEVPYAGEGEALMEALFETADRQRLEAMSFLYEFFDQEEAGRRPRRRTFSLVEMKELVKKVDEWLFQDPEVLFSGDWMLLGILIALFQKNFVGGKNRLAPFLLTVAGEKIVEEVSEAEGILPTANFLGEMNGTMLRPATPAELGQKLTRTDAELTQMWQTFAEASFDEGDNLVFRLLLKKHQAEGFETELWQQLGIEELPSHGLDEVHGHVLITLAAQHREDADLIADESQQEAERRRTAAANKLEQIRKKLAEPAKDEAEAAAKERDIAKLRQQRIRALALAQEAAGREAALHARAETLETKAGAIFDRLEGEPK